MNNLKYFEDDLSYDYNLFSSAASEKTAKKSNIIEIPATKQSRAKSRSRASAKASPKVSGILITCFIVTLLALGIFLRAQIVSVEHSIEKLDRQISEVDGKLARVNFELEQKISYKNLEASATELGMKKMDQYQIVYLRTTDEDKTVVGTAANN